MQEHLTIVTHQWRKSRRLAIRSIDSESSASAVDLTAENLVLGTSLRRKSLCRCCVLTSSKILTPSMQVLRMLVQLRFVCSKFQFGRFCCQTEICYRLIHRIKIFGITIGDAYVRAGHRFAANLFHSTAEDHQWCCPLHSECSSLC